MLAALAVFRIVLPLTTLAAAPDRMPLLPRYDGIHFNGDANGYYEAISNLFAAYRSVMGGAVGFAAPVLLVGAILAGVWSWRRGWHAVGLLLPAVAVSVGVTLIIRETAAPGAPVIGWSLAWAAALFPLPALGLELTPDRAFPVGVALGLLANSVTTVATAYVGLRASHRHSVGLAAAGLFATWPVWVGLVAGQRAWENGQWNVDAGLHLYTEPLSTMLVVVSIAALLGPDPRRGSSDGVWPRSRVRHGREADERAHRSRPRTARCRPLRAPAGGARCRRRPRQRADRGCLVAEGVRPDLRRRYRSRAGVLARLHRSQPAHVDDLHAPDAGHSPGTGARGHMPGSTGGTHDPFS